LNNWQLGNIFFDTKRRLLLADAQQLYLEPRIYQLLLALVTADQQQLSRDQLVEQVWEGRVVSESAINRAVSLLRKALVQLDPGQPYLETLPKVGYRLLVSVTRLPAESAPAAGGIAMTAEPIVSVMDSIQMQDPAPTALDVERQTGAAQHNRRRNLLARSGWGGAVLLLVLLLLQFYWQQQQAGSVAPKNPVLVPALAAPIPRTSDEGIEFQLSLSRDGQWFSYLQQDGQQSRWFLQPGGDDAGSRLLRQQIEVPPGNLRFTSLSPDRNWLLYELCQQQQCTLWLKASPIAEPARLRDSSADQALMQLPYDSQLQLDWQQDSRAFYFRRRPDKTKPYAVSRMELATRAVQQLTQPVTPGGDVAMAISADNSTLAVVSYLQQSQSMLRLYQRSNMQLQAEQQVPFTVSTIAWQNDNQLLFGCGEQICRWDLKTKQVQPLLNTGGSTHSLLWQDGQLWFGAVQHKMEIWRQPRPVAKAGHPDARALGQWPAPEKVIASSRMDWMPRIVGRDLVFLSNRQGQQQIWRQVAGQQEQMLAALPPPAEFVRLALSDDGNELVFSQQGAIYLLDMTTGKVQQLLDASAKAAVVNFVAAPSATTNAGMLIYSSTKSGDYQLWQFDRSTGQSTQLTTQGGYSGYLWQGELWYSKYHQDGLYRQRDGREELLLADFDKINWLNWQLQDGELYFYQPGQGLLQWSVATPQLPPFLLLPTPEHFMHHYQWSRDALWYVKRAPAQGDLYQVALP